MMASDVGMCINCGRGFRAFFEPFSRRSCRLTNILLITLYPVTLLPIYHSTFLCNGALIFGHHQEVIDGVASFVVYLYPIFTPNVLKSLTMSFSVRHSHVDVTSDVVRLVVVIGVVVCVAVFNVPALFVVVVG